MTEYERQLKLQRENLIKVIAVKEKFMKESKASSWKQEQIRLKYEARINRALYDNR